MAKKILPAGPVYWGGRFGGWGYFRVKISSSSKKRPNKHGKAWTRGGIHARRLIPFKSIQLGLSPFRLESREGWCFWCFFFLPQKTHKTADFCPRSHKWGVFCSPKNFCLEKKPKFLQKNIPSCLRLETSAKKEGDFGGWGDTSVPKKHPLKKLALPLLCDPTLSVPYMEVICGLPHKI